MFPLNHPAPTAFYLTLYVVSLVVHVAFMNYVLAGAGYLAVAALFPGDPARPRHATPAALLLRDWLPFAVSAAITAGVAPLLFVQILYQPNFYTANLLLFHRWMAIVPILILGFYLTYLLKSKTIERWRPAWRILVGLGTFACFLFAAWSWTENHLLSLDQKAWPDFYAADALRYKHPALLPRLAVWCFGALPTMSLLLACQLHHASRRSTSASTASATGNVGALVDRHDSAHSHEPRRLAILAFIGIALAAPAAGLNVLLLDAPTRNAVLARPIIPYLIAAVAGILFQLAAWRLILRKPMFFRSHLILAGFGLLLTLLGVTVCREAIRLRAIDITTLYDQHRAAAQVAGLPVFLLCFALNAVLVAYAIRLAKPPSATTAD